MEFYGPQMPYYPQLTPDEFNEACHYFDQKYIAATLGPERKTWRMSLQRSLISGGIVFLYILRAIDTGGPKDETQDLAALMELLSWGGEGGGMLDAANIDVDAELNDPGLLNRRDSMSPKLQQGGSVDLSEVLPGYSVAAKQPYVVYEIHYHLTYQVPCLWFSLKDLPPCEKAWDIETVFRYIVPDHYKAGLRDFGLERVLSCAPNPVTGVPSFFLHPCQTTDAMMQMRENCTLKEYIQIWLGMMGQYVGLHVPMGMALTLV